MVLGSNREKILWRTNNSGQLTSAALCYCNCTGYLNGTVRRRRFDVGRFGDEMWNVFSFGMSPKCKSSHCRREACRRKIRSSTCTNRTAVRAVYPNVHTLIKSMLTISYTTASVERAVYQDGGVTNILAKSLRRRTIELQCSDYFAS